MEEKGVWRTVKGRRIFIRDGEDLGSAMKRSGKFDNIKGKNITIKKEEYEHNKMMLKEMKRRLSHKNLTEGQIDRYENRARQYESAINEYESKNHTTDDEFESVSKQLKEISKRTGGTDLFSEAGKKWNELYRQDKSNVTKDLGNGYKMGVGYSGEVSINSTHPYDDTNYSYANKIGKKWKVMNPLSKETKTFNTSSEALNEMKKIDKYIQTGENVKDYEGITHYKTPTHQEKSNFYNSLSKSEKNKYDNYIKKGYSKSDIENTLMYKTQEDRMREAGIKFASNEELKSIQQQYGLKDKRNEMITHQFLKNEVDSDEFKDYMTRGNESKETIANIIKIRNDNIWKKEDATEIYNALTKSQRNKLSQATKDLEILTKGTPGYENAKKYVDEMENKAIQKYLKKQKNDISPMSEYSDTTGTGLSDKQHFSLSNMSFSEMQNLARDYNIDTKGLSKKQLMAKIIAVFNK